MVAPFTSADAEGEFIRLSRELARSVSGKREVARAEWATPARGHSAIVAVALVEVRSA